MNRAGLGAGFLFGREGIPTFRSKKYREMCIRDNKRQLGSCTSVKEQSDCFIKFDIIKQREVGAGASRSTCFFIVSL